jgi:hypothetical protein
LEYIANVNIKYKIVDRKVRPVATQLSANFHKKIQLLVEELMLLKTRNIGQKFMEATLQKLKIGKYEFLSIQEETRFYAMLSKHRKIFSFTLAEIECINPILVSLMVNFTVPHEPWN